MDNSNDPLNEAKKLLDDLESALTEKRSIWKQLSIDNPDFLEISDENWQEKQARCWLHGATKTMECQELERWLSDNPPISETGRSLAHNHYLRWTDHIREGGVYFDLSERNLPEPEKNEPLYKFILRLAHMVKVKGWGTKKAKRALNSFTAFLRNSNTQNEVAFMEHIFPQKMDLFHGRIVKKIPHEAYPIPQKTTAEILIELARMCRTGRPDAQLTAAESLGLCWLCLTASRLRLPIHLETIHGITSTAIQVKAELPVLLVPTMFGNRPIKTSHRMSKFFNALSRIPSKKQRKTILQRPLRSLTRTLNKALKNVAPNPEYGNITYLSLLSPPDPFGDYRFQPK